MTAPKQRVADPMLEALREAMLADADLGLASASDYFVDTHGPALLARLEELEAEDNPSADALDKLWAHVITKHKPDYGDWEYPGFAFRHLAAEFDDLRAQYEAAIRVLRPFGHPDLAELMGGNVQGDASPVYQRNNALLTVGDFRRAAAVLSHPLAKEVTP